MRIKINRKRVRQLAKVTPNGRLRFNPSFNEKPMRKKWKMIKYSAAYKKGRAVESARWQRAIFLKRVFI